MVFTVLVPDVVGEDFNDPPVFDYVLPEYNPQPDEPSTKLPPEEASEFWWFTRKEWL